jgi:hypothetical protein
MSTAGARGAALDAAVETGPPSEVPSSHLADALAEQAAAEVRVEKAETNLAVVRESLEAARARVAELQGEGE